ncbi:uncharacterized protein LOC134187899 [Corticium candelabrum]|uniref:uncharacterized protein LOC134187899 n=2 Tax=Corticium candelabrum TaxID=121492 RepID=UPI002E2540BB|nr:uncharacterized protein LOC134187899 [Corticium candelabrum]
MSNAFNNCDRTTFLRRLHRELPELFGWVQWSYHKPAELRFGNRKLTSSTGVQQGDPLGPLLFSLVILDLVDEIGPLNDINLKLWYLDDGNFVGHRCKVASLLEQMKSKGSRYGLQLNMSKCEIFWPSGNQSFPEFPSDVERVVDTKGGADFLGSPLWGSEVFFNTSLSTRIDKIWESQQRLQDIEDPQVELLLLRSCLSLCKLNHILRTVPPDKVLGQLQSFDINLRKTLESIVDCSLSESSWQQATLPIRLGGLGLREASRCHPAAYLSSCNSSRHLASYLLSMSSQWNMSYSDEGQAIVFPGESTAQDFLQLPLPDNNHKIDSTSQHQLQLRLDSALWSSLKESASIRDRARLNTISGQHTGAWLRAIPNPNLGLSMPKREFSVALRIWLGIPIFPSPNSKRCPCGNIIDKFGDHLLGCNQGQSLTTKRHDALCEVVYNALLTDDSRCRREARCSSSNQTRPGDVYHPDFERGLPAYFDLSVRSSLQPSFLTQAASHPGAASDAGEMEKDERHHLNVSSTGSLFHPLVVETLGLWTAASLQVLKIIARRASFKHNVSISQSVCHFHQQLSTRLWCSNAKMILARCSLDGTASPLWDL